MGDKKHIIISPYCYPGLRLNESDKILISNLPKIKISKEHILNVIAEECQVSVSDIIDKTRKKEVVDGRHIFCAIARKYLKITLENIGESVGNRDHTTIRHAINKFEERFELEDLYREKVRKIYDKLGLF